MKIAMTGGNGFLGSRLFIQLISNNYEVNRFNVREPNNLNKFLKSVELENYNFIINTSANLNPKTDWDYFINQNLSREIQNRISYKKTKLIHISSLNVINKFLNDNYTKSKRVAEYNLKKNQNTIVIRPSLIIDHNFNISKKVFENYTNIPLFFYPMIFPGSSYNPIFSYQLVEFILQNLRQNHNLFKVYNISGKKQFRLWEIFNNYCINKNKKAVKFDLSIIAKIKNRKIINFFSKYPFAQNLFQLNGYYESDKQSENIIL